MHPLPEYQRGDERVLLTRFGRSVIENGVHYRENFDRNQATISFTSASLNLPLNEGINPGPSAMACAIPPSVNLGTRFARFGPQKLPLASPSWQ